MRAPAFWWQETGRAAALLQPLSALYGAVAARRLRQNGERAGVPVLCIGDLTLGGAGKTPTALAAARLLAAAGERPVFLSRGHGGRLAGPLVVEPGIHGAGDVGDEPLLLAGAFPCVIARDRPAGARQALALKASVIVMDDGFQNPSLVKDAALLVVDAARGVGNGQVFPAGPLRAPLTAQLERAHAVMAIGAGAAATQVTRSAAQRGLPVFRARLTPCGETLALLRQRPVLAFAGIGHPEKFYATLAASGVEMRARRDFADHHAYTAADALSLLSAADAGGLVLATTEKDMMRLTGDGPRGELRRRAIALPVSLTVENEEGFAAFLRARLKATA